MKKALIFSPYLDSLGGGEVYTLRFAACLSERGYSIEVGWEERTVLKKIESRFGINCSRFEVNPKAYQLFTQKTSLAETFLYTRQYDVIFFLSDGSVPFLFGKKNLLHFQVPFSSLNSALINKLKLSNQIVVCNSQLTKHHIDTFLNTNSQVLYPPVDIKKPTKKEKLILGVGRFTDSFQNKRQDIQIKAFKKLVDNGLKDWTLILVGNTAEEGAENMVADLLKKTNGYPIELRTNISYQELNDLYGKSSIYWHAAGYDIDENKNPELVEHFGITTVEAMSSGTIPIVINKGGQKEIVSEGEDGYLFETIEELVEKTQSLIALKQDKWNTIKEKAILHAKEFSVDKFCERVESFL